MPEFKRKARRGEVMCKFIELSCAPDGAKTLFSVDSIAKIEPSTEIDGVKCTYVLFKTMNGTKENMFQHVLETYDEIKEKLDVI